MNRILIIGGYGHVGQKIARRLIAAGRSVTIAGRDAGKAAAAAGRLGCQGVALDLARPDSWPAPTRPPPPSAARLSPTPPTPGGRTCASLTPPPTASPPRRSSGPAP
ncbi:MAG: NAD(P)-binding domain-containing protein [Proteobacteria bacterium]|nr:NAD(P)-binding domain-containing protein [Pseudomonadota bacterium]